MQDFDFFSSLWVSKPAANWYITTSSSIRRQIIISCSKIYFFEIFGHFTLNGHFWPPNFLCEIDKLLYLRCTLIFLHIFWWTTKYLWYVQVIKKMRKWWICRGGFWNTNIHTEKKSKKILSKFLSIEQKCKQSVNTFFGKVHYMVDHNHHMDKWSQYCHLM